jgi:hypothetical protein
VLKAISVWNEKDYNKLYVVQIITKIKLNVYMFNVLTSETNEARSLLPEDIKGLCRMDLPGPTTSVGTRTDYSVGPWDYPACATRHLKAWGTRTTQE